MEKVMVHSWQTAVAIHSLILWPVNYVTCLIRTDTAKWEMAYGWAIIETHFLIKFLNRHCFIFIKHRKSNQCLFCSKIVIYGEKNKNGMVARRLYVSFLLRQEKLSTTTSTINAYPKPSSSLYQPINKK